MASRFSMNGNREGKYNGVRSRWVLPELRIGLPRALRARMADVKWVGEPAKVE